MTAFLTLGLVALGAFVRATGAGLACPDWPLCFGKAVPPLLDGVAQEVIHRYLASFVGVLTLFLSYEAFRLRARYPRVWRFAVGMLFLLAVQIIFGGLTVTMKLNPYIVTTHLALGTVFLQGLALAGIQRVRSTLQIDAERKATSRSFRGLIGMLTVLTAIQILLGGYVGSSGAALACPDIPTCFGAYLPASGAPAQLLHMTHRLVGILIGVGAVLALASARFAGGLARMRMGHLFGMLFLIGAQITLGFLNVAWLLPLWGTVLHLVVAQAILLGLASLYSELNPQLRLFQERVDAASAAADENRWPGEGKPREDGRREGEQRRAANA